MTMRAPTPSEPKSTFPTYQVPQESAMRGSAPPVQQKEEEVAWAAWGGRADPPGPPGPAGGGGVSAAPAAHGLPSVITGSSCRPPSGNSNIRMQSVTENCLLNSVTVPKIQRNDQCLVAHNNNNINSDKLASKFGALLLLLPLNGRDIPKQKSDDDLQQQLDPDNVKNDDENDDALKEKKKMMMMMTTTTVCDLSAEQHYDNDDDFTIARPHDIIGLTKLLPEVTRTIIGDFRNTSPPLRLRGGGESSLSTGTSGWGTPPSQQASNNNANNSSGWGSANPANPNNTGTQQWNNTNRPPASNQGPTSQDANKTNSNGQPPTSQSAGWCAKAPSANQAPPATAPAPATVNSQNNNVVPNNTTTSTKQQLEQLNNMREAIFSQDGWGSYVNQDTSWDIPNSPEPPMKMDGSGGPTAWKPAVNNGTELWEANLRNGGQPPPQPQQKTPWGHTPSTNIGGTWGEDDDTDSSNVWTGVPSGQQQWGNTSANTGSGANAGGAMWGGPKKENDWGAGGGNAGGWGDPRSADPRAAGMDPREMRPDMRDMRTANADPTRMIDLREHMRQISNTGDMRGDPRGITGRLNGAGAEAFWGQTAPHSTPQMHHHNKMPVGGPGNGGGGGAGWEEPSPPSQRRNMPNYDDGTSLWGNPQQAGSHWKDMPTGAGGGGMGRGGNAAGGPPGMPQSRIKPDGGAGGAGGAGGGVWSHGRNGSWDEVGGQAGGGGAGGGAGGTGGAWDENSPWQKQKMPSGPLWNDELDWNSSKQGPKQQLTKEMVWNSKQFRVLVDMGYKKEEVENALRIREMDTEAALDLLSPMRNQDWRGSRHADHYDHPQFPGQRFPSGPMGQSSFQPGNNAPNLLNNMNNLAGANNSVINNISPAVVQKMLNQGGGNAFPGSSAVSGRSMPTQSQQPSTQQLRMLVQQIQMAVQEGYLNHQILNQPLAPQTLILLNQLLQQIKTLTTLGNQQQISSKCVVNGQANNAAFLQCSVLITKTKQQITNLQNQIAAQQAIYVKQQHQGGLGGQNDLFKPQIHESINTLQNNFADLGITKDPQMVNCFVQNPQQSRLNQWINKDKEDGSEFSRAPGSASKPLTTSPNMNLNMSLTQSDGTWSSGRSGDTGWPDSGGADAANDMKDAQWSTPAQPSLTDLVPEFEPGKPWKGSQMKSIEDDPSITPGSVVRSPLSIPTIKDNNELFNINPSKSPPVTDTMHSMGLNALSSSTWSFNPPSSTSSAFTSPQSKLPTSKGGLGDFNPTTAVTSELWGAPKARGPPPGLSAKGIASNGWSSNIITGPWGHRSSGAWGGSSPWLLLRNLTAQIDGSTLRTLCLQHGPLQSFHLYLHQGFALAKYSSREEATKAQTALNNCVLSNTTILAENPSDWDATTLLQQVASQQSSAGGWKGAGNKPGGGGGAGGAGTGANDTWSSATWPNNPTTASLWTTPSLDTVDQARATPSSLNSFLPNDLLGGESM